MKTCRICGEEKSITEFEFRNDSRKHRTECKPCRASREAAKRYGVTVGEVDELREAQGNKCAICHTSAEDIPHKSFAHNPLVIDHDHETGAVRGLLCPTCNAGLGHFKDNVNLLASAITYLTNQFKR